MTSRTLLIVDDDEDLRRNTGGAICRSTREFDVLQEASAARSMATTVRNGLISCSSWTSACPTWTAARAVKMLRKGRLQGYRNADQSTMPDSAPFWGWKPRRQRLCDQAVSFARCCWPASVHASPARAGRIPPSVGPYTVSQPELLIDQRSGKIRGSPKRKPRSSISLPGRAESRHPRRASGGGVGP